MISAPPAVQPRRSGLRPRTPLERGQLAVFFTLVTVTAGAWTLTIHQIQTMDTPRDLVTRGATPDLNAPAAAVDMGMAMDDAGTVAATGMAGSGWSLAGLVAFVVTWAVMMAAMMFPAAAPMILLFRSLATQRRWTGAEWQASGRRGDHWPWRRS